jgi:hypothetical protein
LPRIDSGAIVVDVLVVVDSTGAGSVDVVLAAVLD